MLNCNSDPESGITTATGFLGDPDKPTRVGDVFYVQTFPGRVGAACGAHMAVHFEVVPPVGVTTAISASTPVRCTYQDYINNVLTPAEGCPQAAQPGLYGPAFDQVTTDGPRPWELPHGMTLIMEVPLRSTRRLVGLASPLPSCGRLYGQPPCPPELSGDHLQFANKIIDGFGAPWLVPHVGLFVENAAPPDSGTTGGGAGTSKPGGSGATPSQSPLVSAPRSIRVARLRRGVPVAVRVESGGSKVVARLTLRGRTVAQAVVVGARAGTRTLRLRSTTRGARRLRALRRAGEAILHVRVTPRGGTARAATARVTLLP